MSRRKSEQKKRYEKALITKVGREAGQADAGKPSWSVFYGGLRQRRNSTKVAR